MSSWGIGDVARFLGVKPHVIRYWESELPLLSPRKGLSGRREYTANEIRLLLRFRHLLYDRKFTLEGAKRRLWEELGGQDPDLAARFAQVRSGLIEAAMLARQSGARARAVPAREEEGDRPEAREEEGMAEGELRRRLAAVGQEQILDHWNARPEAMRARLVEDLARLDSAVVSELRERLAAPPAPAALTGELLPAPYVGLADSRSDLRAREEGEEEIRAGRTAFLTVAGGQGSRLGFEGPKGMFPVTPLRRITLFALFAEKLLAARRWYGAAIPWLIMTGPHNHDATVEYFNSQDWFGLGRDTVRFFTQGSLPSLSPDGRLLLSPDGGLFSNPDGHGGVVEALRRSGLLATMTSLRVRHLFYFQVDNPLVRVPDPAFLGFHCRARSRISSKVVRKAYPEEKLGVIVTTGGAPSIIEYSDLDTGLMHARGRDGELLYAQGSPAIHILDVEFLSRPGLTLPLHLARKKAKVLTPTPHGADIQEKDAVKMERFVFDAIPQAGRALFFETERAEEFAPLKNREGPDSVETCMRGQVEQAARWLEACGVEVPRDSEGRSCHLLEISPLFALDTAVLAARRGVLKDRIDEDTLLA
jgi:UDP-N-acetylglucosamine/UDP-N-acetylgalactosamine diphosphorylase